LFVLYNHAFQALKELRDVMSRVTRQAEAAKQGIDEEKKAVVGIRNIREIEYEDGEAKKLEMKDEIEGKKSELDGLQKEHDSLKNMLQSQRSKMDKISLNSS
jgi:cell shape-determining protein MreC